MLSNNNYLYVEGKAKEKVTTSFLGSAINPAVSRGVGRANNEMNQRIRGFVRALIQRRNLNGAQLAKLMGLEPPTITQFLSGKNGAGIEFILALENVSGVPFRTIVCGTSVVDGDDVYPNRAEVLRRVGDMFPASVVAAVKSMRNSTGDVPAMKWLEILLGMNHMLSTGTPQLLGTIVEPQTKAFIVGNKKRKRAITSVRRSRCVADRFSNAAAKAIGRSWRRHSV